MDIKTLLAFALTVIPVLGFSQSQEISDWQQIHPNVIFIETKDFTPEFEEKLISLKQEFIVYNNEISINDIESYVTQSYEKSGANQLRNDGGKQLIKDWIGQNPHIKIITQIDFDNASTEKQNLLMDENALILIGEKLTITDIQNYETTH